MASRSNSIRSASGRRTRTTDTSAGAQTHTAQRSYGYGMAGATQSGMMNGRGEYPGPRVTKSQSFTHGNTSGPPLGGFGQSGTQPGTTNRGGTSQPAANYAQSNAGEPAAKGQRSHYSSSFEAFINGVGGVGTHGPNGAGAEWQQQVNCLASRYETTLLIGRTAIPIQ